MQSDDERQHWRDEWSLPADVTYLNHGSFGPSPRAVRQARQQWTEQLEQQPMDFFVRRMEPLLDDASQTMGDFVGADGQDLVFVDNSTTAMNIVADSIGLQPDDEVLLTDHEYGAVMRIWRRVCKRAGANVVVQRLPFPLSSIDETVDAFFAGVSPRTKLIVVSHITSPTSTILPVQQICERAKTLGIPVCVDGPHALAMLPLNLRQMGCDYYAVSCHKWLCGPFGSGFLYVRRRQQQSLQPTVMSWGRSVSGRSAGWKDEFEWIGTRDPAAFLATSAAIEFLQSYGLDKFRQQTHELAQYARQRIVEFTGLEPHIPDSPKWYGSMISVPLPNSDGPATKPNEPDPLQVLLWTKYKIEIPVIHWHGRRFIRVSCHIYNRPADIDRLVDALRESLS